MKKYAAILKTSCLIACIVIFAAGTALAGPPSQVKHEVVVSADGDGDYYTLNEALIDITDSSPTNKYLIRIRPGTYNCNFTIIGGQFYYVDFKGSGENLTVCNGMGLLKDSEISDMTINYADQISAGSSHIVLDRVTLNITGYYGFNVNANGTAGARIIDSKIYGSLSRGVTVTSGSLSVENSYIEGVEVGLNTGGSTNDRAVTIRDSSIVGGQSAYLSSDPGISTVEVFNSSLSGPQSIDVSGVNTSLSVAGSMLDGTITMPSGSLKLVNCFDGSFNAIANQ